MTVDEQLRLWVDRLRRLAIDTHTGYQNTGAVTAVFALLGASYLVIVPQAVVRFMFEPIEPGPGSAFIGSAGFAERVLLGSIVGPLIETALFQWAPINLLNRILGWSPAKTVLVSAILFAVSHTYSWGYVLMSFLVGLIFAMGFISRDRTGGHAFFIVSAAHALRNLIATIARAI